MTVPGRPGAAILTVGSEITHGRIADTNAQWIAAELTRIGWAMVLHASVDDEPAAITDALGVCRARARAVLVTGGLGPTRDDLTVETVAAALGRAVEEDPKTVARIRAWAAARGVEPPAMAFRMARIPAGAESLDNPAGTAPGIWIEEGGAVLVLLPGVPSEMKAIVAGSVLPRLAARAPAAAGRTWRILGLTEGAVDERVRDLWDALAPGSVMAVQIDRGEVLLRALVWDRDRGAAEARLEPLDAAVRARLGDAVYAVDDETLERLVVRRLAARGATLALAESATGGLIAARLTAVPGASAVLRGGWVAYTPEAKRDWLGLDADALARFGPVSRETTLALAKAARARGPADFAAAVTGWAGPEGGTPADPVGTVYAAVAGPGGEQVERRWVRGDRATVRDVGATMTLDLVRRVLA